MRGCTSGARILVLGRPRSNRRVRVLVLPFFCKMFLSFFLSFFHSLEVFDRFGRL